MSATPCSALSARLPGIIDLLYRATAARLERPGKPGLAGPMILLICGYLGRLRARCLRLAARIEAGRATPNCPTRPRARPARPRPPQPLPRARGWLVRLVPEAASGGSHLRYLLAEPEMQALLAAAPQAGRLLRPLCRMLGVDPPPAIAKPPPRPATIAASPPPPAPPAHPPRRHLPAPATPIPPTTRGPPRPA